MVRGVERECPDACGGGCRAGDSLLRRTAAPNRVCCQASDIEALLQCARQGIEMLADGKRVTSDAWHQTKNAKESSW